MLTQVAQPKSQLVVDPSFEFLLLNHCIVKAASHQRVSRVAPRRIGAPHEPGQPLCPRVPSVAGSGLSDTGTLAGALCMGGISERSVDRRLCGLRFFLFWRFVVFPTEELRFVNFNRYRGGVAVRVRWLWFPRIVGPQQFGSRAKWRGSV